MKNKLMIITGIGIVALVILTLTIYLFVKQYFEFFDLLSIVIIFILLIAAIYLIWDRVKNLKAG